MSAAEQPAPRRRVLVVDDDADIRALVSRAISQEGVDVVEAASGTEALAIAAETPPDLVVLDWNMPGMTGPEVLSYLRRDLRDVPVIMLTAELGTQFAGLAAAYGATAYLSKPFHAPELAAAVRRLLDEQD